MSHRGRKKREPTVGEVEAAVAKVDGCVAAIKGPSLTGYECDCDVCGVTAVVETTEEQCPVGWYYMQPAVENGVAPTVCSDACRDAYERRALESLRLRWRGHVVVVDTWQ